MLLSLGSLTGADNEGGGLTNLFLSHRINIRLFNLRDATKSFLSRVLERDYKQDGNQSALLETETENKVCEIN